MSLTEQERKARAKARDARDLRILELLDQGLTQDLICTRLGCSRGPITRMLADIRHDEAENGEQI